MRRQVISMSNNHFRHSQHNIIINRFDVLLEASNSGKLLNFLHHIVKLSHRLHQQGCECCERKSLAELNHRNLAELRPQQHLPLPGFLDELMMVMMMMMIMVLLPPKQC
ncbi:hypothetical protein LINPERHAP1_LOCUS43350 [Linum perenne]